MPDAREPAQVGGPTTGSLQLYATLAPWWPLISPPEEYVAEAANAASLLDTAARPVREVLELGSGGGHTASHLTERYGFTLVDLSEDMLAVSRDLNPRCRHVRGDMRDVRLGREFDAVLVHDAIDYMTTPEDLGQVMSTAYQHCRPGGVALFVPDHVRESFRPGTEHGGSDTDDGRGARYLEWLWDPDPSDTSVRGEYAFLLRDADGTVHSVAESHEFGLFGQREWIDLLLRAGFEPAAIPEQTSEDREPRVFFVGHRP